MPISESVYKLVVGIERIVRWVTKPFFDLTCSCFDAWSGNSGHLRSEMNTIRPEMVLKYGLFSIVCGTLLVGGCAADPNKPVIDPEGVDMVQFEEDRAKCEEVAQQVEQKAGSEAVTGAVVLGLIGAIFGDSDTVKKSAAAGFVGGGAEGLGKTELERARVVKNCLRARGYQVLN